MSSTQQPSNMGNANRAAGDRPPSHAAGDPRAVGSGCLPWSSFGPVQGQEGHLSKAKASEKMPSTRQVGSAGEQSGGAQATGPQGGLLRGRCVDPGNGREEGREGIEWRKKVSSVKWGDSSSSLPPLPLYVIDSSPSRHTAGPGRDHCERRQTDATGRVSNGGFQKDHAASSAQGSLGTRSRRAGRGSVGGGREDCLQSPGDSPTLTSGSTWDAC